jgi:hypothetical protein
METPASLASGSGGKLLGTERLSALPFLPQPRAADGGVLFAEEVSRAAERAEGEGLAARRMEELEHVRRAERRSSFDGPAGAEAVTVARPTASPLRSEPLSWTAPEPAAFAGGAAPTAPFAGEPSPAPAEVPATAGTTPNSPTSGWTVAEQGPSPVAAAATAAPVATALENPVPNARPAEPVVAPAAPIARPEGARVAKSVVLPEQAPPAPELERAAEILRQIQLHTSTSVKRLTLDLEPAELGRLSVQLALRAGKVSAIVRSDRLETLELLQRHSGELLQVLSERGIAAESVRFERGFAHARALKERGSNFRPEAESRAVTWAGPAARDAQSHIDPSHIDRLHIDSLA